MSAHSIQHLCKADIISFNNRFNIPGGKLRVTLIITGIRFLAWRMQFMYFYGNEIILKPHGYGMRREICYPCFEASVKTGVNLRVGRGDNSLPGVLASQHHHCGMQHVTPQRRACPAQSQGGRPASTP